VFALGEGDAGRVVLRVGARENISLECVPSQAASAGVYSSQINSPQLAAELAQPATQGGRRP
jgi:hypothetical protein